MNTQFTVTLNVDIAKISEVYEALQLVNGVHIGSVESSTAIVTNGNGNGHSSEAVKTKVKPQTKRKTTSYQKRKKSVLYTDPRAVLAMPPKPGMSWPSFDIEATLKNLGITRDELEAMATRNGTLECALKRSIAQKEGAK